MCSRKKVAGTRWWEVHWLLCNLSNMYQIEYNCMLFLQVNFITPGAKSLDSPWGLFWRFPSQARTLLTPLPSLPCSHPIEAQAVSASIPKANDIACICLCLHIDFIILYVCSRTWKSSWLLAIISMCDHIIVWHPHMCCDRHWLALNMTMINDSLAIASPTLTCIVSF